MSKPLKIFITYSHKNTKAKDQLLTRLGRLKREGVIDIWHDNEILPGDKWRDTIFSNLADSDLLLYLTSAHSLDSENCNEELAKALNAEIRVIPIILEHWDWQSYQLSDFQALPDRGKPIDEWQPESKGWQNVVKGIRKVVKKMQIQVDPSSNISQKELHSELAFQHGNILMMLGQLDMAIEAYSNAINLNPRGADAYNNRDVAYLNKVGIYHATVDFNRIIQYRIIQFPSNSTGMYNNRGASESAIADFTKAIQLKLDFAEAYFARGLAYGQKEEFDLAIKDFDKAIRLKSDFAGAYFARSLAYDRKEEFDLAIKDFDKAIELNPDDPYSYNNRGFAYANNGEFDKAIEDTNTAIKLKPDLAEAYDSQGFAYAGKGEFDKAIEDYNTAIEFKSDNAVFYSNRGEAWLHLGKWEKARKDLTTAKNMGMDIIAAFHKIYASVEDFEQKTGIQLPPDIAEMLTRQ